MVKVMRKSILISEYYDVMSQLENTNLVQEVLREAEQHLEQPSQVVDDLVDDDLRDVGHDVEALERLHDQLLDGGLGEVLDGRGGGVALLAQRSIPPRVEARAVRRERRGLQLRLGEPLKIKHFFENQKTIYHTYSFMG